ncbi:NDP-hexose 2,3-dehydratase family protein [Streptomyces capitiformicae]|uniref:NDP-hexose 2,3-dehydratase n=1 Tax=Streptomyces capitiformicae TaxID=2014920 RepID=A0A918ZFB3_9ACTN|nr:NDP-hexose 2,3-dehydratase family protein [Streptomyces capitiformicae]GHE48410.1 NDP-hexose 2,3-dehydratase [Streptomyces capitiformicae]
MPSSEWPPVVREWPDATVRPSTTVGPSTTLPAGEDRLAGFQRWFGERARVNHMDIGRVPLHGMTGWLGEPGTGNLCHTSGRFYSVEGLQVQTDGEWNPQWTQPVIVQPEMGVLGLLVKEVGGTLHCLMQAKVEPGNMGGLQLSPTVQATRSNFTGVHGGRAVKYVEYFTEAGHGRVVADSLQSEQGSWFLGKRNRNIIVQVFDEIPVEDDFRWLTLDEIGELLRWDNLVNMDSRTVLSCLPPALVARAREGRPSPDDDFGAAVRASFAGVGRPVLTSGEVLSRLTDARTRHRLVRRRVPLDRVRDDGWQVSEDEIARPDGKYFRIIGVEVQAGRREVASWAQPLLAPTGQGTITLAVRRLGDVLHALVRCRAQAGTLNVAELGPTVQHLPANYAGLPEAGRPPELEQLVPGKVLTRFDAVHSEEGGRFHHAVNRYRVVEAIDGELLDPPTDFMWVTLAQLADLLRHSNYLNVELRSLIACLHTL